MTGVIRRATPEDAPAIGALWFRMILEENPDATPDPVLWVRNEVGYLNCPSYYEYVAVEDNMIVGFNAGLLRMDPETGLMFIAGGSFYVLPEYRGSGAGYQLHKNSIKVARELGAHFIRRHISAGSPKMLRRAAKRGDKIKGYAVDENIRGIRRK